MNFTVARKAGRDRWSVRSAGGALKFRRRNGQRRPTWGGALGDRGPGHRSAMSLPPEARCGERRPTFAGGVAMLLLLLLVGCGGGGRYRNFPPTATGPWIAFGDSLTQGFGAEEGSDYPAMLGKKLGIPIINQGVAGDTSVDGLTRLPAVVAQRPRVVLLCFGGNDTLQSMSMEETFTRLETMIDQFHDDGSFVVLIGIRSASVFDKYEARFKRLAKSKKVLYVPNMLDGILNEPKLMSDMVHPNDAGYERVAARLDEILRPLLPQLN